VIVDGVDSGTGDPSTLRSTHPDAFLALGEESAASLVIRGGGLVELDPQGSTFISSGMPSEPSEILIEGANSRLKTGQLLVGTTGNEQAYVTLAGGTVDAASAFVGAHGVIRGVGTLTVDPTERFINDGGTISPGFSPGTLTINGNFRQTSKGRLLLEIGGTNSADCDHLIVTNTAELDGELSFRFINGFAPKAGQQFSFLEVNGGVSNSFANIGLENLAPGFQFSIATNGTSLTMTALNDGQFSPTLPGQVAITVTNIGGIACAIVTMTVSNTCHRITLEGGLTRTNQSFYQALEGTTLVRNDCTPTVKTVTNTLILGALSPGNYSVNLVSGGAIIQTIPFTVSSETNRLLGNPSLLSNGKLQFQLDGFSPLRYSIEASLNLKDWVELENGPLPSKFTDSDTALYPQRFYRARIFQ
jgi:hypothetical protein